MSIASTGTLSSIAVIDKHGDIVWVNQGWKSFGDRNGLVEGYTSVGKNYVTISQQADDKYGERVAVQLGRLLTDRQTEFTVVYPCHSPNQERWVRLYAIAVSFGDTRYYLLIHQRIGQKPPLRDKSPPEVLDAPEGSNDYRDHNRLVTYTLSSDETVTDGLFIALDAIGIDVQSRDTTLHDWIDSEIIKAFQTSTSNVHMTFSAWNYPVSLTPEQVVIYTPERSTR